MKNETKKGIAGGLYAVVFGRDLKPRVERQKFANTIACEEALDKRVGRSIASYAVFYTREDAEGWRDRLLAAM